MPLAAPSAARVVAPAIRWPKDVTAAKNVFYGDFHKPDWQSKYLIRVTPPFQMFYGKNKMPSILVNRMCSTAILAAFNDVWNACDHDQVKINASGASDFGGCFNIRPIAGRPGSWSNHSWACAIDLSPSSNGFNVQKTTLSHLVIDAFDAQGARWGGRYKGRKDPMHFEFVVT